MDDMTIALAKIQQQELEVRIANLLAEFSQSTGLVVRSIDLDGPISIRNQQNERACMFVYEVTADVTL